MADAKVENIDDKKIEEIDDDSDDDVPELEGAENPGKGKQSRGEKKTRKALQKLGLKDVEGITKVTVRKGRQVREQKFFSLAAAKSIFFFRRDPLGRRRVYFAVAYPQFNDCLFFELGFVRRQQP
jgi:hypothetical protein